MQSGRVAPVDNSRKEERRGEEKGEKEGKKGEREEEERKKREKRSPLTMGSRDFGPLTS